MTSAIPIPAHDHLALPGPAELLVLLVVIALWLHLICAGAVLGSTVVVLIRRISGRNKTELDRQLNAHVVRSIPMFVSLLIVFGIGALFFVQGLYGVFLHIANIFIGCYWVAVPGVVLAASISIGLARRLHNRAASISLLTIAVVGFALALYVMTNSAVLTVQPERWLSFQRQLNRLHVPDAVLLPRLLHNVGAVFVVAGLAVAWIGRHRLGQGDIDQAQRAAHATCIGLKWLLFGLIVQVPVGIWHLLALPTEIRNQLLGFGGLFSMAWYAAIALVVATAWFALKGLAQPANRLWLTLGTASAALGMLGMIGARQLIRACYLARPEAGSYQPPATWDTSQNNPMLLFMVLLAAGVLTVAVMLLLVLRGRHTMSLPETNDMS